MRNFNGERILFVTGRLAEPALKKLVQTLARKFGFEGDVVNVGVQVAALMHVDLLLNRLSIPAGTQLVILPGWCGGDLGRLTEHFGIEFERGPKDLHDLPAVFSDEPGQARTLPAESSIEIIAEINHATRLPLSAILEEAARLTADGANLIDVGCIPGESSPRIKEIVEALRRAGQRVSIDSFDRREVEAAVQSGAELVLSCRPDNVDWLAGLGVEVVAIPESAGDRDSLDKLVERLDATGTRYRIDPILEPIGFGFARSLQRYIDVRQRYPHAELMMGIGNVTELSAVDSAGVNFLLAAVCEELGVRSVLTTQVINWCRTAVAEIAFASRLVHLAVRDGILPKHIDDSLVMLRDARVRRESVEDLSQLAGAIRDANFRIFATDDELHIMNRDGYHRDSDPFELMRRVFARDPSIVPDHAFYLGYEMARAEIAMRLGKHYLQDQPLNWGLLTFTNSATDAHSRDDAIRPDSIDLSNRTDDAATGD